jgi:A/G-specific adenine glycosylase
MLQQTQMAMALPYYRRFLARFPDVHTLAAADLSTVLAVWQGLGYYSRARNLHRAAQEMVRLHQGNIPSEWGQLISLPGIGEYTAGAILSIAYGQDYVAVDGNVKRILARVLDLDADIALPSTVRTIAGCTRALLPSGRAGAFNQALMDLGSGICIPRGPLCPRCPISDYCLARLRGTQDRRPVRAPRAPSPLRHMVGAYIRRPDGRWLVAHRRPSGLLGGLWEIPMFPLEPSDLPYESVRLQEALASALNLAIDVAEGPVVVNHAYTHFRVRLALYTGIPTGQASLERQDVWDDLYWLSEQELPIYALTGLTVKALRLVDDGPQPRLL